MEHNFNIVRKSAEIAGRTLTIETGRMAKQAGGAVFVTYGKTCILATATADKEPREGTDFFPLTVDFIEKMYAAGKIPGGFFKREARPSTEATLNARLIDRPIRPLFPKGFRNSVHVVITVLAYDGENDPGMLGILGASAALSISDIPFNGPVSGVGVGLIDGEIVLNPTQTQLKESTLELSVAASETSVVMIEAGAQEVGEDVMMDAVYQGHEVIKQIVQLQKELMAEVGKPKMEVALDVVPEEILTAMDAAYGGKVKELAKIHGKQERDTAVDALLKSILETYQERDGEELFAQNLRYYKKAYDEIFTKCVRQAILFDHHRVDGRGLDDIRPISCEIDVLPIVHGSALFTRGETQSLGTVTLGTGKDEQIIDSLKEEYKKHYFLHYNFPPFSVGEAAFMRGPGRRELGHGALAERALAPMLPSKDDFPYTIRVVSEILESNGSSSMATVCSGTLALMAAGVPLKKPVAGIANGLIMEGEEFVVLTDIQGLEDHLGDMDFKVTGTEDGITAMQMDIKIEGITKEIMGIALKKAKAARLHILERIVNTIPAPRAELADTAPRIVSIKVDPNIIGTIIGPGGKMIKQIVEASGADIDIQDDGTINIASPDGPSIAIAKEFILNIISSPEMNEIYTGEVFRIEPFGAFVKFMNGTKDGLVHISQMHEKRLRDVTDMVKIGDKVNVKYIGEDRGKFKLTMKGVEGNPEPPAEALQNSAPRRDSGDRRPPRNDRGDHRSSRNDRGDRRPPRR
ncbi:MAG: polyribonucleotide nucleotidyltransferase [Candidatus Cloacimonetes bacterium]|nr:polyribonucleotide nucleotidyltransferase [Candidatus Cloacimonadota bacterium]